MSTVDQTQGLVSFIRTVEAGSFSGAARMLASTPSAISKSVARLESRLATRLFRRSTRLLTLTDEGQAYYVRVAPLIQQIESATDVLMLQEELTGSLRVTLPTALGDYLVDAVTREFMPRFPGLRLQMSLTDRHADVIAEGFDLAVRAGRLADTTLTMRSAGAIPMVLVASPAYLDERGRPADIDELNSHAHIRYLLAGRAYPMILASAERPMPAGRIDVDSSAAMLVAAVNGAGIAQLLRSAVGTALTDGRLEEVLPDLPPVRIPIQVVHAFGRQAPARVQIFSDFVIGKLAAFR